MSRPRLLDLFSGAGGAACGYQRTGFHVTGVDIKPQPRYVGERFVQADVMEIGLETLLRELGPFEAVHASPPCHDNTSLAALTGPDGTGWMLPAMREQLAAAGLPWVLENVPGAPMRPDIVLCGSMFGLRVWRHRWFEFSEPPAALVPPCGHIGSPVGVYGHTGSEEKRHGARGVRRYPVTVWREAMGIDWMTAAELAQAIPPAYAEWIGRELIAHLERLS